MTGAVVATPPARTVEDLAAVLSIWPRPFDMWVSINHHGGEMKYALLMYQDKAFEAKWATMAPDELAAAYAEFERFGEAAEATGAKILGGNELDLSHTATTVRRIAAAPGGEGDDFVVTDGPFAEVAEHLGGYFEIEARDLDHAIEVARLLPIGTTEIRPIPEQEAEPAA